MTTCVRALVLSVTLIGSFSINGSASITGTVTDTQSNPVSGALVTFTYEADSEQSFSAYTDESGHYAVQLEPMAVEEDIPTPFSLGQNYPNPFNPATTVPFTLHASNEVSLTIYNIMGQRICRLLNTYMSAGTHSVAWNGMDEQGHHVSAGVYFYTLRSGTHMESRKMLLLDGGIATGVNNTGTVSKMAATNEVPSVSVSVRAYGFSAVYEDGVELLDNGTYEYELSKIVLSLDNPLVAISGGTFQMGDIENAGASDETPIHTVTVSTFEMCMYEITNAQYAEYLNEAITANEITATSETVTGATGAWSGQEYIFLAGRLEGDIVHECRILYNDGTFSVESGYETLPVVYVTWYGAKAFAEHYGVDLPREAEWEYTCRWGDNEYMYGTGDGTISLEKANYWDFTSLEQSVAVGSFSANPFGIHDMSGNVSEWCSDWYGSYASENVIDPAGASTGVWRVVRGGNWSVESTASRSANRDGTFLDTSSAFIGFRVARRPSTYER